MAAWLGPQKLARAILFATLTNCVAFLPLLLVTGKTGEFIWSLPVVVTASLVASRIVSMTFMPLLGYYVLKGQKGLEAGLTEGGRGATFARYYNGFSEWCLDHKAISLGVCLLILGACLACLPLVGTAFFPRDRHSVFTVNVYLPEGTPIRQTAAEAQRIIAQIDALEGPHIRAYTTFVGAGGPRFWLSIVPEQRADNYAQILVHTTDGEVTSEVVHRLKRSLPAECLARVTIEQLETGPPVGVPVQIRLFGEQRRGAPHAGRPDQGPAARYSGHGQHPRRLGPRGVADLPEHRPGPGQPDGDHQPGRGGHRAHRFLRVLAHPAPRTRPVDPHHAAAALRRADAVRGPDQSGRGQLDHQ